MRLYIENTGHIKKHENFKILFWSRESKKQIFKIFPDFFTKKWAGNLGITSETTWLRATPFNRRGGKKRRETENTWRETENNETENTGEKQNTSARNRKTTA